MIARRMLFLVRQWEWWILTIIALPLIALLVLMALLDALGRGLIFITDRLAEFESWLSDILGRLPPNSRMNAKVKAWEAKERANDRR